MVCRIHREAFELFGFAENFVVVFAVAERRNVCADDDFNQIIVAAERAPCNLCYGIGNGEGIARFVLRIQNQSFFIGGIKHAVHRHVSGVIYVHRFKSRTAVESRCADRSERIVAFDVDDFKSGSAVESVAFYFADEGGNGDRFVASARRICNQHVFVGGIDFVQNSVAVVVGEAGVRVADRNTSQPCAARKRTEAYGVDRSGYGHNLKSRTIHKRTALDCDHVCAQFHFFEVNRVQKRTAGHSGNRFAVVGVRDFDCRNGAVGLKFVLKAYAVAVAV